MFGEGEAAVAMAVMMSEAEEAVGASEWPVEVESVELVTWRVLLASCFHLFLV